MSKHQRIQLYQSTSKLFLHSSSFFCAQPPRSEVARGEFSKVWLKITFPAVHGSNNIFILQNSLQSFLVFQKFGDELVLQRVLYEVLLAETKLCLHQNSRLTVVEIQPDLGLFMNEKIRNIEIGQQLRPYVTISIDVNGRTNIFHARGQQLVIFFDSFVSTFYYLLSILGRRELIMS